jgi:hypothetical protein
LLLILRLAAVRLALLSVMPLLLTARLALLLALLLTALLTLLAVALLLAAPFALFAVFLPALIVFVLMLVFMIAAVLLLAILMRVLVVLLCGIVSGVVGPLVRGCLLAWLAAGAGPRSRAKLAQQFLAGRRRILAVRGRKALVAVERRHQRLVVLDLVRAQLALHDEVRDLPLMRVRLLGVHVPRLRVVQLLIEVRMRAAVDA